jgi:polysaccharide biosynthesis protein PslG
MTPMAERGERSVFQKITKAGSRIGAAAVMVGTFGLPAVVHAQSNTETPINPNPVCVSSHLENDSFTKEEVDTQIDLLIKSGAKTTRFDFEWDLMNRDEAGVWDFHKYDYEVDKLNENGIKTIALMPQFAAPEWAVGEGYDYMNIIKTPEEYANYVGQVAEHFKGRLAGMIIGNEVDINWAPNGPNLEAYVKYLNAAHDAIKLADPDMPVIASGLTAHTGREWLEGIIKAGGKFDGVDVHVYDIPGSLNIIADFRDILDKNSMQDKFIILGEFGNPTYSGEEGVDGDQQAYNIKLVFGGIKDGKLPLLEACVYDLKNDGPDATNKEDNYGIYNYDNSPKPAVKAVQDASASFDSN